jgi:hypothetical protein
MKSKILSIILVFITLLVVSCSEITRVSEQSSTGGINEILVITNSPQQWTGEIGDTIRKQFTQDLQLLPVPEPQFNLVNLHESSLSKDIFKKHHNIFIINIDTSLAEANVDVKKNLWANPQIVISVNAPNHHECLVILEQIRKNAMDLYLDNERTRISNSYGNQFKNNVISGDLRKYFNLEMNIPKGYELAKIDSNNAWIRKETAANSMNILIMTKPYTSLDELKPAEITKRRNQLTQTYIPGPTPGSFQTISDEYIEPISRELDFHGWFAVEIRGLWKVENDFMGGPFISYTFVDQKRNRLITIDAFLYGPKQKKAPFVRELEAILWSSRFME